MTFERLGLFSEKKEALIAFGLLTLIFFLHVSYKYYLYRDFLQHKSPLYNGTVLSFYEKRNINNRPYHVLKISTPNQTIYTTLWKKHLHVKVGSHIEFRIIQKNITFLDFLSKKFYAPIYALHVKKGKTIRFKIKNFISNQHEDEQMSQLYSALFLATPIDKNLRQKIQNWGISHLVAISGFHLGVIYGAMFFLLKIIYGFFQNRYFPYRDLNFDIGIFIFIVLAFYAYLIDFAPSFLRAFVMSLVGFYFYIRYFRVISFMTLAVSVAFLLAFFPYLLLSLGFWFSVMGVFYIFLYLHHFKFKWWDSIFVNIWVFLAMVIPVHGWFAYTSWQQFGAILLSIVFVLFYPLAFLLHVIGYGGVLDSQIIKLLNISSGGADISTPLWLVGVYLILSLGSILNRYLAIFTVSLGALYFFFI